MVATIFVRRTRWTLRHADDLGHGASPTRGTPDHVDTVQPKLCPAAQTTKRPSCWITSPSAVRRPPRRRSQMRSQCRARLVLARPSRGRSGRARGAPCRRSSRRRGSCPTGRSMPKFVPMPTSPRRRAPSSVASARCRYSSPVRARAATTSPPRSSSSTPSTSTPAGEERTREAHVALGAGLVRAGEDLAAGHVAPPVGVDPRAPGHAQAQVGALRLDAQLARRPPGGR